MSDYTEVNVQSAGLAHLVDIFLFKGAPLNCDQNHPVTVLVNHGYVVGYSPSRLQPAWSAYRVAFAKDDVDYDRPHLYYADVRLEGSVRLNSDTFGSKDGVKYHVGHMAPNAAINTQFGRLAQMETFFMSNMSPQRGTLNQGVWLKLEKAILEIDDSPRQRDHMWVVVGPIFGDSPDLIQRSDGKEVPIPDRYFCITVDPYRYPWDEYVEIVAFDIPQEAPSASSPIDYITDISSIEEATGLKFMPGFEQALATVQVESTGSMTDGTKNRLLEYLQS